MILLLFFSLLLNTPDSLNTDYKTVTDLESQRINEIRKVSFNPITKELYFYEAYSGYLFVKNNSIDTLDQFDPYLLDNTLMVFDTYNNKLKFIDSGLGRVFEYDQNNKLLERIDRSYNLRAFYNFRASLSKQNKIIAYGGYGEFTDKTELLSFNSISEFEWESIHKNTHEPDKSALVIDMLMPNDNYINLFAYSSSYLKVYTLSLVGNNQNTLKWEPSSHFYIPTDIGNGIYRENSFSNYRTIDNKFNMMGNYFYDLNTNELLKWETSNEIFGVFQSSIHQDSLYVVLNDNFLDLYNPINLVVQTHHIDDFFAQNIFTKPSSNQSQLLILILVLVVSVILLSVILYKNKLVKIPHKVFEKNGSSLKLHTKNGIKTFIEEDEIMFLNHVNTMYENQTNSIELDKFDDLLFNGIGYKTHMTSKRNSIITNINDQIGDVFINKTKGKHDKRRVVLNFDFTLLK